MTGEFCVVCGRSDRPIVDGECADCYAKHHPLVSSVEHPVVVLCPTCGARKVGRHWERSGESTRLGPEDLLRFLVPDPDVTVRHVSWTETGHQAWDRDLEGEVRIRFRDQERTDVVHLKVHIDGRTCPECSRRSGRYYTAVIQLRAQLGGRHEPARVVRQRLAEAWDRAVGYSRVEWRKAMSFREELPEGFDLFFVETEAARAMAHWMKGRLHATLTESATLWGRKDGRDVYRVTYCLRLPRPEPAPPATSESPGRVAHSG